MMARSLAVTNSVSLSTRLSADSASEGFALTLRCGLTFFLTPFGAFFLAFVLGGKACKCFFYLLLYVFFGDFGAWIGSLLRFLGWPRFSR